MSDIVTAAMLVIGDEILSGRTKDRNIGHLADIMTAIGIDLKEVRIVPDEEDEIVAAVNALRHRYDYVFTTGGIGPTHDDITADSVAKAFGVPCDYDAKALALLAASYAARNIEFTEARKRMARMPVGADPHRQSGLGRAGLSHRQRPCHGRRAVDLPGHARQRRADAEDRREAPVRHRPLPAWRGRHRRAARPKSRRRIPTPSSAPIRNISTARSGPSSWCARARKQALDAARPAVEAMVAGLPKAK